MGSGVIRASGAKLVGRSHTKDNLPCQDAVTVLARRDAACIALADGAGSKHRSEAGARIASARAAQAALDSFDRLYLLSHSNPSHAAQIILKPVLVALRSHIKRKGDRLDSLASTLLFLAYKDGRYIAGHLGDGAIGVRHGGIASVLSAPHNGEYANITYFVTDKDASTHLRLYAGVAGQGFGAILMSDGTAEGLYEKSTGRMGTAAEKFFEWSDKLTPMRMEDVLLANLEQVFSKKTTDDCSIAVMTIPVQGSSHV